MSERKRVLVVDDEPNIRRILEVAFDKMGWSATVAEDGLGALAWIDEHEFDCVLTDVTMPGMTGYELLREIKARRADLPVVIMTAFGTIPQAVHAIRDGAYEYITKPFDLDVLKKIVSAAMEETQDAQPPKGRKSSKGAPKGTIIGRSPAMLEVLEMVQQVADARATVLISGESGVGKEVIARALHEQSSRAAKPYVAVSCAALPETLLESELFGYEKGAFTGANGSKLGRFEMAHEGTLFLDEIGEVPLSIQVKLLRVLQEREFERLGANKPTKVDVRLVTATNRDLREAVQEGSFRLDLLYRLQVVELVIPPLRDRVEDILPLAEHFLAKYAAENNRPVLSVDEEALSYLSTYAWPGNVRELENTMERAVVLAPVDAAVLTVKLLPNAIRSAA